MGVWEAVLSLCLPESLRVSRVLELLWPELLFEHFS